jgi:uncharacterized protein YneF (UPF0154 family)
MPEHIRALIIIVVIGLGGFYFAEKLVQNDISSTNFKKLRNVWLAVILAAFLSHNYWLFLIVALASISLLTKQEKNRIVVFFILVFSIPTIGAQISGFGLLNQLFFLSYPMFISLVVLLPTTFVIAKKNNFKFTSVWSDKFLLLFILLVFALKLRDTTFTDALRGSFYDILSIFLPYYVTSRGIKNISEMNSALQAFIAFSIVTSLLAIFEFSKFWVLFGTLGDILGTGNDMTGYMGRQGSLRAVASLVHSLILGTFLAVSFNFYLYTNTRTNSAHLKKMGGLILLLGLFATISRGPWVGALAGIIVFTILGKSPAKKLGTLFLYLSVAFTALSLLPGGGKFIEILPFIGQTDKDSNEQFNVNYRERLLNNAFIVINKNPLFGSTNYLETPEMQEMIQGEGIVDIVNSYVGIALNSGYVGLSLFIGMFFSVILGIRTHMKKLKDKTNHLHILGASLISAIFAFMITIATTSLIGTMPIICSSILGLGVAYTRIVNDFLKSQTNSSIV